PDIEFYSLQKTGEAMPPEYAIMDHMNLCHDFADTAALVANLGLVISVDTAMAHLVGALGKPVWMLNRFDSCWRWLQNRDDSPW
ncbi:glycosyltransferase family 9 protein, partial [Escherichia coli]